MYLRMIYHSFSLNNVLWHSFLRKLVTHSYVISKHKKRMIRTMLGCGYRELWYLTSHYNSFIIQCKNNYKYNYSILNFKMVAWHIFGWVSPLWWKCMIGNWCEHFGKGKAIPLQVMTCPEGSRRLRLPDFKTIGTWRWQGCQPCVLAAFTPRKHSW
jgi:hypothetical protein